MPRLIHLSQVSQRLMVQGTPGATHYTGSVDAISKIVKADGIRGLYRGFGMSVLTYSPSSAVWWAAYGSSQRLIWRCSLLLLYSVPLSSCGSWDEVNNWWHTEIISACFNLNLHGVSNSLCGVGRWLLLLVSYSWGLSSERSCQSVAFWVCNELLQAHVYIVTSLKKSPQCMNQLFFSLISCRQLGYGVGKEKELPSQAEVVLVQALGGVTAGGTAALATTPMDTVKTRLQVWCKHESKSELLCLILLAWTCLQYCQFDP